MGSVENISFKNLFLYFCDKGKLKCSGAKEICSKLFGDKFYNKVVIPEFQRGYVWNKKQIDEVLNSFFSDNEVFFGFFVVSKNEDKKYISIIDGQQRFVTFILILVALYIYYKNKIKELKEKKTNCKNNNDTDKIKKIENIIKEIEKFFGNITLEFNNNYHPLDDLNLIIKDLNKLKVQKSKEKLSEETFKDLENSFKSKKFYNTNIYINLKKIYEKIKELKNIDFLDIFDKKMICLFVCNESEAYEIFVSLNEKGIKLKPIEIISCYIFEKVKDNKDKEYNKKKKENDEKELLEKFEKLRSFFYKKNEDKIVLLPRNLQKLIWYYLLYKKEKKFPEAYSFKKLDELIREKSITVDVFVNDIYKVVEFFYSISIDKKGNLEYKEKNEKLNIKKYVYLLNVLGVEQHWPIIIKLIVEGFDDKVSEDILRSIYKLFVLMSLFEIRTNVFESNLGNVLRKIDEYKKENNNGNNFETKLKEINNDNKYPFKELLEKSKDEIKDKIKNTTKEKIIKSLLVYLYFEKSNNNYILSIIYPKKIDNEEYEISLEHLFPKKITNKKNKKEIKYIDENENLKNIYEKKENSYILKDNGKKLKYLTILYLTDNKSLNNKMPSEKFKEILKSDNKISLLIDYDKNELNKIKEENDETKKEEKLKNLDNPYHEFWKKREEELVNEIAKLLLQDVILEKIEEIEKILKNHNKKSGKRKNENVLKNLKDYVNNKKYGKLEGFLDELKSKSGSNKELKEKIEELEKMFLDLIKN